MDKVQAAKELMIQEKKDRAAKVVTALKALLDDNRCKIEVVMTITQQGNIPSINIIAED
jgi:hypothetical protein